MNLMLSSYAADGRVYRLRDWMERWEDSEAERRPNDRQTIGPVK